MASFENATICAALAAVLWTCIGLPLSSRLMTRSLAWPVAPALGWAVHSAAVFPVFCILGMTKTAVISVTAVTVFAALVALWSATWSIKSEAADRSIPLWTIVAAAILAIAIMTMVLPKITEGGVTFSDVIFDHSKVAMIDDMARSGVPAGNPFFGESDGLDRLSYYYLWHFSAAELVVLTGLNGWEADAGMTCFTAFSSLLLMMGFASFLSERPAAAGWVVVVAAGFSIRPLLRLVFGEDIVGALTGWPTGFGAWLFQMTWAPQHVASAGCVVIAVFLFVDISRRQSVLAKVVLSLLVAAAFESSTWVGGVTFPLAAAAVVPIIVLRIEPSSRLRFVLSALVVGVVAMAIASPFIFDQFRASAMRSGGLPIGITPYDIQGYDTRETLRSILDIPAYWTVFLFTEFAAFYPAGVIMMVLLWKDRRMPPSNKAYIAPFGILALASLAVGSVLISRLGGNNDLGWRGVLPSILVLIIFAAAGLARYLDSMPRFYAVVALSLVGLGSFEGIRNLTYNLGAQYRNPSLLFVESARMWDAVRKHSGPDERVANNPLFLANVTRWPINLSWALLSNRRSCYAGSSFGPFAPRTKLPRDEIDAQFDRVFSGHPEANDLSQLAKTYNCSVVVVTPQDGAWNNDPFASSPLYHLVEKRAVAWRIYKLQTN